MIATHYSLDVLLHASSSFALCSVIVLMNMPETLPVKQVPRQAATPQASNRAAASANR